MRFWTKLTMFPVLVVAACAVGEELADEPSLRPSGDAGFSGTMPPGPGQGGAGSSGGTSSTEVAGGSGLHGAGSSSAGGADTTGGGDASQTGTAGAGLDGDRSVNETGTGGARDGSIGQGGRDAATVDGAVAVDSATGCVATQKSCGERCVVPSTSVGCGLSGCDACVPGPSHSVPKCTGVQCDFDCSPGYARSGAICVLAEGGTDASSSDANSTGDAGSGCDPLQCGGCIPFLQAPCCRSATACGCRFPFAPCM
jgi:hypothetical protein